jgi:undecaprenyl-diphosphatase
VIETLEQFDSDLFLVLNSPHSDFLDTLMWYISTTWLWIPVYAFMLFYAFKKGRFKFAATILGGVLLCVLFADLSSVHLFKNVFLRYRPSHNLEIMDLVKTVTKPNGQVYLGGQFGFVSSHAANIGAITTFILFSFIKFNKKWFILLFWAALVMYSRIYLGVHYPGDILGGAVLGFLIGFLIYKLTAKLNLQTNVK